MTTHIETPFGAIDPEHASELLFPLGIPGFPAVDRFVLAALPGTPGPFCVLHGLGETAVDLVVTPWETLADRVSAVDIDETRQALGIAADALQVLFVVTLPPRGSGDDAQVNVRAPLFVDVDRRVAVQMVLGNPSYQFRQPLAA
ncbi:MAG: flagellar assembly protein FliW [Pseudomonadota bacterium]